MLKLPKLIHASGISVTVVALGALAAALCAFLSVTFLTRYFKTNTLTPFAIYCVLVGVFTLFVLH